MVFKKIVFVPSEARVYQTKNGKNITYKTIVLASNNTVIFDNKYLGMKKDDRGDRQVYRIKDVETYKTIFQKFSKLLNKE